MSENLPPVPDSKFNSWCERNRLTTPDRNTSQRAMEYFADNELTKSEASAYFLKELTGCNGFEFVAFSSSILENSITLNGKVTLVPCFSTNEGGNVDDPLVQKTLKMRENSRFVYDGWIPISDWSQESVRKSITELEQILSLFSLKIGTYFEWKPKYGNSDYDATYKFKTDSIGDLELLSSNLESISQNDRETIYRSISWFSQAFRLKDPAAKFLFFILTVESLADYIEKSNDNSSLYQFRADTRTRSQRKTEIKTCVEEYLQDLDNNPFESIQKAYLNCVESGSTMMLKKHIEKSHGITSETYRLLFENETDNPSLYNLRHKIAHGNTNLLTEIEREKIKERLWDAERVARGYLLKILQNLLSIENFSTIRTAEIYIAAANMIGSQGMRSSGSNQMAIIYG